LGRLRSKVNSKNVKAMKIISNLLGFVKSVIKINPLFFMVPMLLIGMVLFLRRSRPWKESFADTRKILNLLLRVFINILSVFFGLFGIQLVKMFDEVGDNV